MAKLVVITHEFDRFVTKKWPWSKPKSSYLLFDVLRDLETFGHSWRIAADGKAVEGDVAILHVDQTIVDQRYLALGKQYQRTVNLGASDISKRRISSVRVLPGDDWAGPVIVKANRNARGSMEVRHNMRAARMGRPEPVPGLQRTAPYKILDSISLVEEGEWNDPELIVERYLPERDGDHYVIRTWVFMGSRERCTKQLATDPIVKADKVIHYEPCEVPDGLRAERERLGFDFGKFDFVMHDGKPLLLDTNKTPGVSRAIESVMKSGVRNLAEGLEGLIRGEQPIAARPAQRAA